MDDEDEGEDVEEGVIDREDEAQDSSDTTLQEKVHLLEQSKCMLSKTNCTARLIATTP
jgi:hypothetical protein